MMVPVRQALFYTFAAVAAAMLLASLAGTALLFVLGGSARGEGFSATAALDLLMLVTINVGLALLVGYLIRRARQ